MSREQVKPVAEMRDICQGYDVTATAPNSIRYLAENQLFQIHRSLCIARQYRPVYVLP
jgi:hypothetical protein